MRLTNAAVVDTAEGKFMMQKLNAAIIHTDGTRRRFTGYPLSQ